MCMAQHSFGLGSTPGTGRGNAKSDKFLIMSFYPKLLKNKSLTPFFCAATLCAALAGCSTAPDPTTTQNAADNSAAPSTPAATGTLPFKSKSDNLSENLKKHYVDFSFDSPDTWELTEAGQAKDAVNFVKIERNLPDRSKGDFSQESFAVGYFTPSGDAAKNAAQFPQIAAQLSAQLQKGFPDYKKISEGKTKIGDLEGYEFRFQSQFKKTARTPMTVWGRVVLLPKPSSKKGVTLTMLASNLAPEIKSAADVGEKGQLPNILKSFKFEK